MFITRISFYFVDWKISMNSYSQGITHMIKVKFSIKALHPFSFVTIKQRRFVTIRRIYPFFTPATFVEDLRMADVENKEIEENEAAASEEPKKPEKKVIGKNFSEMSL